MNFLSNIWGWIKSLFNTSDVEKLFGVNIIPNDMIDDIKLWDSMFRNKPPWLTNDIVTLGLTSIITRELRNQTVIELKSTVNDDKVNATYQEVIKRFGTTTEYMIAKGGVMLKPYKVGNKVYIAEYQPERFDVTALNSNNEITGVIFTDTYLKGDIRYTKLEYHNYDALAQTELIQTKVFKNYENGVPKEISINESEIWRGIPEEVIARGVTKPLFVYYKTALPKTVDYDSPWGVSYFARTIDIIKSADEVFSSMLWEYEGSKLKVFVDETLLQNNNSTIKDLKKLFLKLNPVGGIDRGSPPIEVFSPIIRHTSYSKGLDVILKQIEDNVGLNRGTLATDNVQARTATEVKILKQRIYATIDSIQVQAENALTHLAHSIYYYHYNKSTDDLSIVYDFGDSIITDSDRERELSLMEVKDGLMSKYYYLRNIRKLTEEETQVELQKLADEELSLIDKQEIDITME